MRLVASPKQEAVVTLRWNVDQPVILHFHGCEIKKRIERVIAGEFEFTARASGRSPIHDHGTGVRTGTNAHEEAPLGYVEVCPQ